MEKDDQGKILLHYAAEKQASDAIVQSLLTAFVDGAQVPVNCVGNLLHPVESELSRMSPYLCSGQVSGWQSAVALRVTIQSIGCRCRSRDSSVPSRFEGTETSNLNVLF